MGRYYNWIRNPKEKGVNVDRPALRPPCIRALCRQLLKMRAEPGVPRGNRDGQGALQDGPR